MAETGRFLYFDKKFGWIWVTDDDKTLIFIQQSGKTIKK
jgi:hypothetical protein